MLEKNENSIPVKELTIPLERDVFLRTLIRELSGLLEEVVGLDEAEGFISVVGQNIGKHINQVYREACKVSNLSKSQIADVLGDLKARIQGDFFVESIDSNKVVFGNRVCPFGDKVKDRPSLCMMTSNVFGTIAADNNGYAKVSLKETIARGDRGCRVVVYFEENDESIADDGREYYKSE